MTLAASPPNPWLLTASVTGPIDEDEVRRILTLMVDPEHHVQIQALPSGRWRNLPGHDLEGLVECAREFSDEKGVYFAINPIRKLNRAAKNPDVVSRRWFFIDVDTDRPGLSRDTSSTDEEKAFSHGVCLAVRDHLSSLGWPEPILVDSGNGWHLYYRVDLPNEPLPRQWLSRALKSVGAQFGTKQAHVDTAVVDAKRITKIAGTWVRKGANTPDRPWRMARLIEYPSEPRIVPSELIRDLAGLTSTAPPKATPPPRPVFSAWTIRVNAGGDNAYVRSVLEREIGKVATALQDRNTTLFEASLKLGGWVASGYLEEPEVIRQLTQAARAVGLGEDGDPGEIQRAITNGLAAGKATPKRVPEHAPGRNGQPPEDAGLSAPPSETPLVVLASTVQPKAVDWLWPNRIPKGFITVFAGRTGLGKSFVTCDITARVTNGDDWPDSEGECVDPGNVLLISEDPFEYVLTPRLIEMGADLDRVYYLSWEAMAHYQLADTAMLEAACVQAGDPVLVVIDPPTNFLGERIDEHKNSEVRRILMNVVAWLNGRAAACILITHVNKNAGKGVEALNRVIGSVAWTTTSRVAHSFTPDPKNPVNCLFTPMKSNLGMLPKGLAYRIAKTDALAKVEWLGESDVTANDAMEQEKGEKRKEKRCDEAKAWLLARFAERAEWPSRELFERAAKDGIPENAVYDAKKAIPNMPKARPYTDAEGNRAWIWRAPPPADDRPF